MAEQKNIIESAGSPGVQEAFVALQNLTPDGFMLFRPVRDARGEIIDLEWTFVNAAAGAIVGRDPEELVGKRLLEEMPGNRDDGLFDAYVDVIETGTLWQQEFHYDHGGINAWFRTTAAKAGDGLALSFADISEIRAGDERLKNLIDSVIAFVGVLSLDGVLLEANRPAIQAAGLKREELIGRPFWECFWWSHDTATQERLRQAVASAARGEHVRYDVEIRVVGDRRIWIDFQIVPVTNAAGEVVELIPSGVDITDRKRGESHRELLIRELSHRVKNTLATIQSMAGQTIKSAGSLETFRDAFNARLRSMAASHDLLVASEHSSASLSALIEGQVLQYAADPSRLVLQGEAVLLPGDVAHMLGMVLHELATNASKYGALSVEGGKVHLTWETEGDADDQTLKLIWSEHGGPEVAPPTRRGFGTRLIERSLSSDTDSAEIEYDKSGVVCRMEVSLR